MFITREYTVIIFRWKRAICNVYRTIELFARFRFEKNCVWITRWFLFSWTKTIIREAQLLESIIYIAIPLGFCRNIGYNFRHLSQWNVDRGRMHARSSRFLSNRNYQLLNASSLSSRIFVSSGVDKTRKDTIGGKRSEQLLKENV